MRSGHSTPRPRMSMELGPRLVMEGLWLVGDSVFPGPSTLATALGGVRTAARIAANLQGVGGLHLVGRE
jgi:hypothetical protein